MVAVVGRPAKRELAQIARADDEAARSVGEVHKLERPDARLPVFKRHVKICLALADVSKMAADGIGDRNFPKLHAELLTENLRVRARALRRAEAGHRDGEDIVHRPPELFHRVHRDEKCKAAVKSSRNADDRSLRVRVLHALGKPVGLHPQNELAALGTRRIVGGNKRGRGEVPRERNLLHGKGEGDNLIAVCHGLKACVAAALGKKSSEVELCAGIAAFKRAGLGEQRAVFCDQIVPGEDHVGRRLAVSCVGVEIGAKKPCRLLRDERFAVLRLADRFVAGREIRDNGCASQSVRRARRKRRPEVLADFDRERKFGHAFAAEQELRPEQHMLPREPDVFHAGGRGAVVPLFIKLAVVRNMGLRHKAKELPAANNRRTVIELAGRNHGKPHERDQVERLTRLYNLVQRILRRLLQRLLQEKIAAGVAREPKLGENGKLTAALRGLSHGLDGHLGVIGTIRHAQRRGDGAGLDKTVVHACSILFLFVFPIISYRADSGKPGFRKAPILRKDAARRSGGRALFDR